MTELEKELTIKVKRLEDDCKAYNFTQHELQETIDKLEDKLANADYQLEGRDITIKKLEAQNKELRCCANCNNSYGGEEEPSHDCGYCHAMQCICKLKLEEHTSDIYRMWEEKCERWEMRVN